MAENVFAGDFDALAKAGYDIHDLSAAAHQLLVTIENAVAQYGPAISDDEIGDALRQNYKPGEQSALQFMSMLYAALEGIANGVTDIEKILKDLEHATSVEAMKNIFNHYKFKI